MERYINVDETLKQIREDYTNLSVPTSWSKGVNFAIGRILRQPTEDVVKVVRCKDCKYYRKNISCVGGLYNGCSEWLNEGNEIEVREDGYCSYGEKR